jgi:hypothetical protein
MNQVTTFVVGVDDFLDAEEDLLDVVSLLTLLLEHSEVVEDQEEEVHTGVDIVARQFFTHTINS